jgi:Flp pilus assembly protein TadG
VIQPRTGIRNRIPIRIYRDESGQALVLVAVGMAAILSFAALAIDVGQLHYAQSKLQAAADAAAIAGALEISYCGGTKDCTAMQKAAQTALVENGFSGSTLYTQCATAGSGLTITVNNAPCALGSTTKDPEYGNPNYVEAVVTKSQPTYFAGILGIHSVKITTRAEATIGNDPFCVYLSGPTGDDLKINGSGIKLTASCGIMDNSTSNQALLVNGSGNTLSATTIDVAGNYTNNGSGNSISPTPVTGATTLTDPLSWVPTPTAGSCTTYNGTASTIGPGTYCSGLTINGSNTVTFSSGVYIVEGAMTINGTNTVTGNGVTFYFTSGGSLTINGNNHVDLVAPTTGNYAGILFDQNASDTNTLTLNGDSTSVFQGAIYAPGAELLINGGGNVAAYTIIDTKSLLDNGTTPFNIGNDYSSLPGGSPAKSVTAVLAE